MVIMAKQFYFHQTRGHLSKKYDLCPHVQLQTVVWLFYGGFGAVASSLLSGLSDYVTFTLHLSHLADALLQSDLQIGAFTL